MSEEEVSYLDLGEDLQDIPDEKTLPSGEYEVRLASLELTATKKDKDRQMLVGQLEVVGEPLSKLIYYYMLIAKASDDERTQMRRKRAIKKFYTAFGIPLSGPVKFQDYLNNTTWATLVEENDNKGNPQNRLAGFTREGQ